MTTPKTPETPEVSVSISMSIHLGDRDGETGSLSLAEYGAFCRLTEAMWRQGGKLQADQNRLRRLARADDSEWKLIWPQIRDLFDAADGHLTHRRTMQEIERARNLKSKRADAGRAGGLARGRQNHGIARTSAIAKPQATDLANPEAKLQANDLAKTYPPDPSPSPDPSPDPSPVGEIARVPAVHVGKPTPYTVVSTFLAIRAQVIGGTRGVENPFARPQPKELEKAEKWLDGMTAEEARYIEPAIRLACQHVVDGASGWTHEAITKAGFLLSCIISNWRDLCEELQGVAPAASNAFPQGSGQRARPEPGLSPEARRKYGIDPPLQGIRLNPRS